LRGWLTTAATRIALNMRRSKADRAQTPLRSDCDPPAGITAPDLALLKERCKPEVERAVRRALDRLPAPPRSLLLPHDGQGVTLPQLAAMHGASRATIARWLASARETLRDEVRRELRGRLQLTPSEYESLTQLVQSEILLSFADARTREP